MDNVKNHFDLVYRTLGFSPGGVVSNKTYYVSLLSFVKLYCQYTLGNEGSIGFAATKNNLININQRCAEFGIIGIDRIEFI